ncbi:hypothetical protein BGP_5648 [Beggiatoa sp. PS]|nr:hypothetical protein BGP_5648 [Beggiatoa sp. PS]
MTLYLYYTQRGNKFNFSNEVGGQKKRLCLPPTQKFKLCPLSYCYKRNFGVI